jgi:hypothetical protein
MDLASLMYSSDENAMMKLPEKMFPKMSQNKIYGHDTSTRLVINEYAGGSYRVLRTTTPGAG